VGFIAFAYGVLVYLFFLATFLYTIGFVEDIPGIKNIDSGPLDAAWTAVIIDLVLLSVFAIQHSVMARQGFKRWWTRFVPSAVERTAYVLAASLAVALLLWQWRPLPGVVWSVENRAASTVLIAVSAAGWVILLISTFLINHFELFGLQQVYQRWR
jgi:protein-S-isoprenylcysteine O-methyltransferase Ste14